MKSDKCRQEDCCIDYRDRFGKRSPGDIRRDQAKRWIGIEPKK
jgi:hypothetical protein